MSEPLQFDMATPRFGLPLLFSGQAQKEAFVNESMILSDTLLHCCVEAEVSVPPEDPGVGTTWLIREGQGIFAGHDGELAILQAGGWRFIAPRDGLRIFDQSQVCEKFFCKIWQKAQAPQEPVGGLTVDVEARAAITALITALQVLGVISSAEEPR